MQSFSNLEESAVFCHFLTFKKIPFKVIKATTTDGSKTTYNCNYDCESERQERVIADFIRLMYD